MKFVREFQAIGEALQAYRKFSTTCFCKTRERSVIELETQLVRYPTKA